MAEQMSGAFALLLGRRTFEIFASYWPQHADGWPGVNEATKYVVSNTLTQPEWSNSVVIGSDVGRALRTIKAGDGPDLHVYGSANLVQTLLRNDLVDELWLKTFPITLGQGKRLFADGTSAAAFTLESTTTSPSGVIIANYKRAGQVRTGSL
jgi:dihydrofolate reductase